MSCHDGRGSTLNVVPQFSGTGALTHHDVSSADQAASGARIECADCHNPHRDTPAQPFSNPDSLTQPGASNLGGILTADRRLYLLVGAKHDGVPPVISNIARNNVGSYYASPVISWTTNEPATSWIDYGTTTSYELGSATGGAPFGDNMLVTSHQVTMSGLSVGTTYHYRVRTADALGNVSTSADMTYTPVQPPASPVLASQPDTNTNDASIALTLSWNPVTAPDGHAVQYRVYAEEYDPGDTTVTWTTYDSGWISATSWTNTFWTMGNFDNPVVNWKVMARDATETWAESAWSTVDDFRIVAPTYSCPELYTWDGTGFRYITDVMGLGPVGVKKGATTYLKPEPVEDTIIPQGALVPRDGKLDLHVTDEKREIEFVDRLGLTAIDHPVGTRVLINDLHWGVFNGGREPTEIHTISDPRPVKTTYERVPVFGTLAVPETDVSDAVAVEGDGVLAPSGLYDDNVWTFDLGKLGNPAQVKLVMSGWMEYATPEEKAAWIASGKKPPVSCFEVMDANGNWVNAGENPHIANYTKTVVYDFSGKFPAGVTDHKVRMHLYMRMNLDWVAVDTTPDAAVTTSELALSSATLSYKGPAAYTHLPYPTFDYGMVVLGPAPTNEGAFTRYGDVKPLLTGSDDKFVVMDSGDDIALSFEDTAAPAPGMVRTYMMNTDGFHQTITHKVDPMPFHAMSNYPYPAEEHYPDDADHQAYLAGYNTRIHTRTPGGPLSIGLEPSTPPASALTGFAALHQPVAYALIGQESRPLYSVDTDLAQVLVTHTDGTVTSVNATACLESASVSAPASPSIGAAVSAVRLGAASVADSNYLRSDLTTADGSSNWQILEFDLGAQNMGYVKSISYRWTGHGEPTPGYPTTVRLWDPSNGVWVSLASRDMPLSTSISDSREFVAASFCLGCHDGTAPADVKFPAGSVNIGALWTNATSGDFHGARAGSGFGSGGILTPYQRGQGAMACTACHASHGSSSVYHFPSTLNGNAVGTVASGTQVAPLCASCHGGGVTQWHSQCNDCHEWGHGWPTEADVFPAGVNCFSCHGHGKTYTHPGDCQANCHFHTGMTPPGPWQTF